MSENKMLPSSHGVNSGILPPPPPPLQQQSNAVSFDVLNQKSISKLKQMHLQV